MREGSGKRIKGFIGQKPIVVMVSFHEIIG